jgi:beta-galactosidase
MKIFKLSLLFAALMFSALAAFAAGAQAPVRSVVEFNAGWKFLQGDQAHAEQAAMDDSGWQNVTVPHDWSIAGPVDQKNPSGPAGGFFPAGIAWYRKTFNLPAKDAHRHVYIAFDGVMANWVGGQTAM